MKPKKHLNFTCLRHSISKVFNEIQDKRQANKKNYSLHDALMSGFACMHFQDPSLLQFQQRMQEDQHRNNLKTLFGVEQIPKETQMREIIDGIDSDYFKPIFKDIYQRLQRSTYLDRYKSSFGSYYFPIDGSEFYQSKEIHCSKCLVKEHKKGAKSYSHQVLQGGIMHPKQSQVIPFMPEQICNEDGQTKQDCEINAAKRFLKKLRKDFPKLKLTIGGDALFSRQPLIELVRSLNMGYIFTAKLLDHQYMKEWLNAYEILNHSEIYNSKEGKTYYYEWMNDVPLNGREDAVSVNYFSCKILKKTKKGELKQIFKSSWVTDHAVTAENIEELVKFARCRWKNENECFNVMKNHGYYMDRNYGHGKENLCFNFYLLTLLAFLFHQIFELTDKQYQDCRKKFGSKKHLWEKLRAWIDIIIFETWESLLAFALAPKKGLLTWAKEAPS